MHKTIIDTQCAALHVNIDVYTALNDLPPCRECGGATVRIHLKTAAVAGDDIPGGVWIKHGICNADGTPRRYDSYSSMKKAADAKGLTNLVERGSSDRKDYDKKTQSTRVRV